MREGGLPSLISMACSADFNDQKAALCTIRGICAHPENRREVMEALVSEALTLGSNSPDEGVKFEASSCFCALSINDENKLDIANDDVLMANMVDLLKEDDVRTVRQIMGTLSNISERHDTHAQLLKHQFHLAVLTHIDNDDVALVRETTRLMSNLVAQHTNHPPIVQGGGIEMFKTASRKLDAMTARFASIGFMNLTSLPENHKQLFDLQCFDDLIDLASGGNRFWISLDLLGNVLIDPPPMTPRDKVSADFIDINGFDKDARRYAILAIGVCIYISVALTVSHLSVFISSFFIADINIIMHRKLCHFIFEP